MATVEQTVETLKQKLTKQEFIDLAELMDEQDEQLLVAVAKHAAELDPIEWTLGTSDDESEGYPRS